MFKIQSLAVYPAHGVGIIEGIETFEILGSSQDVYVMRILENNMIIRIPTKNVKNVGLREIIDEENVPQIYRILATPKQINDSQTWNRRYRDYMEKIKAGSIYDIAEVYRDLAIINNEKDLSFGERKMLDTARSLIIKELSLAKKVEESVIEQEIDIIVPRAQKVFQ